MTNPDGEPVNGADVYAEDLDEEITFGDDDATESGGADGDGEDEDEVS